MSAEHPTRSLKRVAGKAREYLTSWAIAGVTLTLTGFTPDLWVANALRLLKLPGDSGLALPAGLDLRVLLVGTGVALVTGNAVFLSRRAQRAPAVGPTADDHTAGVDLKDRPSIAVLPFVDMSGDKDQDYFADGITEDLITGLSCDNRLSVVARNSTFAYKGQSPDIRAVGRELGVRYVVEGSIRPVRERLRITVQLIEAATGIHVWADKMDRPAAELFEVLDEVVDGLVTALCANVGVAESTRAKRHRPEDLQAWALCVQAEVAYLTQPNSKSVLEAEKLARRAAEIEPGYAVSWALLAFLAGRRRPFSVSADLARDAEEISALVDRALRLAPNDPVVLAYCGAGCIWAGQAERAIDCLERSLAIHPNNSFSQLYYGAALWANGNPQEAITRLGLFLRRSPKDPYSGLVHYYLSYCHLSLGDHHQTEQAARNTIKHSPAFAWGYLLLALSQVAQGRDGEAQQQIRKVRELAPGLTRQYVESFWRHIVRNPDQAGTMVAQLQHAWRD